ncbi:WD domain, G-beta repeat protein (macronuclear) [Tetrahymena thermophila SB210]|uniref:WD domain, G-beta repeat protein n=1 Tax=Tetrahymena thermophila (strain SB210) TaxID=312017 RepID=Q22D03_TETTS|nr:WD domain, G-beta repeat protein [Tetrahymena thermophila SB210]EAR83186.3 WD domain, G-beta repeat protein [Tetrahymena thermophila SB210]|eukprot:XP_001030849.3 WD domain, G-beta repeat protein [Tetrahymena thermophila SB210]
MRVKSVGTKAKYLTKLTKNVEKFKNQAEIKETFPQVKQIVLDGGIVRQLFLLSRIAADKLKNNGITRNGIKQRQHLEIFFEKGSKNIDLPFNHFSDQNRMLKSNRELHTNVYYVKKLYNRAKLSQVQMLNRLKDQIQKYYVARVYFTTQIKKIADTNQENQLKVYYEKMDEKQFRLKSCQMFILENQETGEAMYGFAQRKIDALRFSIKLIECDFRNQIKVELSKIFKKVLPKIGSRKFGELSQQQIQIFLLDKLFLQQSRSLSKALSIERKQIQIKNAKAFDEQKILKKQEKDSNNSKEKFILNLDIKINIGNSIKNLRISQPQRVYLLNLIQKNQMTKFNNKLFTILTKQAFQNEITKKYENKYYQNSISQQVINQITMNKLSNDTSNRVCIQTHQASQQEEYQSSSLRLSKNNFIQLRKINILSLFEQNGYDNFNKGQLKLSTKDLQENQEQLLLQANKKLKQQFIIQTSEDKLLGGGICGSKSKIGKLNKNKQMKQIIDGQEQLKKEFEIQSEENKKIEEQPRFKKFNDSYSEYFTTKTVSEDEIETDVRLIIEETLFRYREQIVRQEIRHKVINMINLLINYLLIIRQSNSQQSIQSDINSITDKLLILITYCKENKDKIPCLDLFQYFDFLKTLNSQRQGLDEANKSVAVKIISKIVQIAKFGAGFVSIAGAVKNLTEIDLNQINQFINEIKQIVQQITSKSSTEAVQIGLKGYSDYNTNNIANNMQALWLKKVEYLGENISQNDAIQEIFFYLEESPKITNKDIQLFVYMQLNYLLSKQKIEDNFDQLTKKFKESKKQELIIQLSNILQVKDYSDSIADKIKNIASLIASSNQFRYIKAQLLLYFAQILLMLNAQNEFTDIMINIVSNYLQEKQKCVQIIYKNNWIMADFIHKRLDKALILIQINEQKNQLMKHLENKQQYYEFANSIQNENDLDKLLAKYYVEMWEQSVKQRQKNLEISHKDDALLEAIHLYVNQQITYLEGYKINTEEKDAVKQIIDQFLIPNFESSSDDVQDQNQQKIEKYNSNKCRIISILAEGGSGKSMLLKKLEVELLKGTDSEYTKDQRSDFIPFIIKCNSLDREKPSIEDYLQSVNIKKEDVDLLKKSERNKLIMLDGYDEYTGDYFKVYQKLKLNEWVNTLVIVTSRLEKITVSDAKKYFSYYDNQGKQGQLNSYAIFKLEKITKQDIEDYLEKYKKQQGNQRELKINQLSEIIHKNQQLTELLMLPINLYLTTRMIADIDLGDQKIIKTFHQVSDQVEIQELFFQQQFKKQSQIFIEKQNQLNLNQQEKQELIEKVESCYFEYFQSIAMKMLIQKGQKLNYLSITRDSVQFQLREEISTIFKKNKLKIDDLIKELNNYVDSRIITRVQLKFDQQNNNNQSQNNKQKDQDENKFQEFEFRHKSLFEYFAARAMKYDFDIHRENIYKLDIKHLKEFNINKRIIMSNQTNASESQILQKFYKLMQSEIDSQNFKKIYAKEDISQTSKYIQYIKKSTISKNSEKSQIDIGASNLLSALFLSKFYFPNLIFEKCSFSQAYISSEYPKLVEFKDCNLSNSFILKQNLENYETSNLTNASFGTFQKQFDTQNFFSFNGVIFHKGYLVSITNTGYVNQFDISQNNNQTFKLVLSKKITDTHLKSIRFINAKNIFVIRTNRSLFEINPQNFEIINTFTFAFPISSFGINDSKYIITLNTNQTFYGDIQNGFKILDENKFQATYSLLINNKIITSTNKEVNIYDFQTHSIIESIKDCRNIDLSISSLSPNCKYLATVSDYKNCKIWNLENGFQLIKTIEGHQRSISSITFSADGKYLATGSKDSTCQIWNAENDFQLQNTIEGHKQYIYSVAFSADGKYLATSSEDDSCKIWDIENGFKLKNSIQGHTQFILSSAFSADGKYLATGSKDFTCNIWNLENGYQLINTINGHTDKIQSVDFSADGKYLATGSQDKTCKIWNVQNGFQLTNSIEGHNGGIFSVNFSADSKYLATGSDDGTCKIWNAENRFQLQNTIEGHSVYSIDFSTDGNYLATGSQDGTCKIWNLKNEFQLTNTIESSHGSNCLVAFSSDCNYLATGSGGTIKIWNAENGFQLMNTINGDTDAIYSLAFSPDSKYLAIGCFQLSEISCKIWDVENGFQMINAIETGHVQSINSVTFSADSKYLATGSWDKTFKIWNVQNGFQFINTIQGHTHWIYSVAFSTDSKYLATGSIDKTCKIWNVENGFQLTNTLEVGVINLQSSVAFSANGKYLATGSENFTCKIWNAENGFQLINKIEKEAEVAAFSVDGKYFINNMCDVWNVENGFQLIKNIEGHPGQINSVAFSADGKYLAVGTYDYTCQIWNVENGFKPINTLETGYVRAINSIAFSPNGKYLATAAYDNPFQIWNVENGFQLINKIEVPPRHIIVSIAFSADSKYLATGSHDKTCKIWSVENGFQLINTIEGHTKLITSIAFSADGKYLATGSHDNTCKIWDVENGFQLLIKNEKTNEINAIASQEKKNQNEEILIRQIKPKQVYQI